MATTTYTSWTRLFGDSWENAYNADPNNDLILTPSQREEFLEECRNHLCAKADKVLAPFGAEILGNGEIIGQWGDERWPIGRFDETAFEGDSDGDILRENLSSIDFDDIISRWLGRQVTHLQWGNMSVDVDPETWEELGSSCTVTLIAGEQTEEDWEYDRELDSETILLTSQEDAESEIPYREAEAQLLERNGLEGKTFFVETPW